MKLKKKKAKTYVPLPLNLNHDDPSSFICGECSNAPLPPGMKSNRLTLLMEKGAVQTLKAIPGVVNVTTKECGPNCLITIEYSPQIDSDVQVTTNPQEAEENSGTNDVLKILSEEGYSFTIVVDTDESSNDQSSSTVETVRSRLHITSGLCCPTEVPIIKSLLKPLNGVSKVGVNVATKIAWIDHSVCISAKEMRDILQQAKFTVEIVRDGHHPTVGDILVRSKFVESTLLVKGDFTLVETKAKEIIEKLIWHTFHKSEIRALQVNVPSRTLKVEHHRDSVSVDRIKDVIMEGLAESPQLQQCHDWDIQVLHDGVVEELTLPMSSTDTNQTDMEPTVHDGIFAGLKVNVVISGIFWVISLMSVMDENLEYLKYAGIISVLSGMPPVLIKASMTIRRFQFDANCMMVIAALGALALGEYDEAASVSFLFAISEWLEAQASGKARRALNEIVLLRPEYAHVINEDSGLVTILPAENVPLGSLCRVRTGDKVTADGIVIEGSSSVDESSITGESRPVDKVVGNEVSAGAINVGSTQLIIKTTSTVADSTLSRLIALVEEAQTNQSETEKLVDTFAKKYTPFVLFMALLVCTVPWVFGVETGRHWTINGLIIIVIACPCALTISTPVTYSAGLAATAKRGIIIKGGSRLEALGSVKTAIFDKTGTLTQGRFALNHLEIIGKQKSRREVLELLAAMEAPSSHPLSAALVAAAKAEDIIPPKHLVAIEHTILKGEGVSAFVENKQVYVGNKRLFKRRDMYTLNPHHLAWAQKWDEEGGTVGYIGIEGQGILAMYSVTDTIRDESRHVVTSLINNNIHVIMLTGDGEGAARSIGEKIGLPISSIQSQFLPEDKLHYVSSLKDNSSQRAGLFTNGRKLVMMIGDGVNDAPALAVSDVGVAMGQGAALALEMSDITLIDSDLNKLLFSMNMGCKVITTVKENIVFSLVTNAIAVGLTFAGKMTLLLAIVCDVGVMLLVTLNGMKLLSERTIRALEKNTMDTTKPLLEADQADNEMQPLDNREIEIV